MYNNFVVFKYFYSSILISIIRIIVLNARNGHKTPEWSGLIVELDTKHKNELVKGQKVKRVWAIYTALTHFWQVLGSFNNKIYQIVDKALIIIKYFIFTDIN